jgi:HrpA-like RNA helicase
MLSVEDIWWMDNSKKDDDDTNERRRRIEIAHARFRDSMGDFVTYFNVFSMWIHEGKETKSWCENNFIKFRAMRTAKKIRDQLISDGLKLKSDISVEMPAESLSSKGKARICYCVSAGLYMNAARRIGGENMYRSLSLLNNNVQMYHIHPNSSLRDNTADAEFIVYQELLASGKLFMKHVSVVNADTLERRRASYRHVSANRLSGIPDPVAVEKDTVSVAETKEVTLPVGAWKGDSGVNGKGNKDNKDRRSESGSATGPSAAELAKQRYLERKRKASSI